MWEGDRAGQPEEISEDMLDVGGQIGISRKENHGLKEYWLDGI